MPIFEIQEKHESLLGITMHFIRNQQLNFMEVHFVIYQISLDPKHF